MTRVRTRRGGQLWLAVLVVSALTLGLTGWRIAEARTAGAEAAPGTTLAAAPATPVSTTPTPRPSSAAPSSIRPSSRAVPAAKGPVWPTHPATAVPAARVARPERLTVPALGLDMPVVATTVDPAGLMALPAKPSELGWYAYGPAPGSVRGTAVLGGHLDSLRYGTGPLVGLASLDRGDELTVTTAKGQVRYEVVAVQRISKRALDPGEVFDRQGEPLLRVITCGGTYDRDRGGYQDNVVLTARPR